MSQFAICTLASVPLRKHPDLLSEMTSQLLFGDHYEVLDENGIRYRDRGDYSHELTCIRRFF